MSQIVNFKGKLFRINPQREAIEYSTNGGSSWYSCHSYRGCSSGEFRDLCVNGTQLLAATDNGVYYSSDGSSWYRK